MQIKSVLDAKKSDRPGQFENDILKMHFSRVDRLLSQKNAFPQLHRKKKAQGLEHCKKKHEGWKFDNNRNFCLCVADD